MATGFRRIISRWQELKRRRRCYIAMQKTAAAAGKITAAIFMMPRNNFAMWLSGGEFSGCFAGAVPMKAAELFLASAMKKAV